jgi:cytidyltransferase-like protein
MTMKYKHAALGGTFDYFHEGHRKLIDAAFHNAEKVSIGITSNEFAHKMKPHQAIQKYEDRVQDVREYLKLKDYLSRSSISKLTDPFGFSTTRADLDCVVVTMNTKRNAKQLNDMRKSNKLSSVKIVTVPFSRGPDRQIISSTRIRLGEIDHDGNPFLRYFTKKPALHLPVSLREELRKPLGILVKNTQEVMTFIQTRKPSEVIAVGDIISESLRTVSFVPSLSILDFKSQRKRLPRGSFDGSSVLNPAGTIRRNAVVALHKKLRDQKDNILVIKGEEDLLTLPAILMAPLGSVVAYGQRDMGVVMVEVTEERKSFVKKLIEKFD